ncbi:MAG: hypothetical protein NTY50_01040 [Methylobacter sp.]|nr:hypothetical protein [Methylobacter sp.]
MKTMLFVLFVARLCSLSVHADVQADGASFCADNSFTDPVSYVAIRNTHTYGDVLADEYIEQARWKGHEIKKGTVVKVYAIGRNCNDPKMEFMNTDNIGFTGVKSSDFKKVK